MDAGMPNVLTTERMVLRRFTAADLDHLYELDNDPEVMRFLNGGTSTPREVIQHDILPRFLRSYEHAEGFGYWAAIEQASGDFLGWFSFRPTQEDNPAEVELGYRLRRAAWGQGYATEGSRALIQKGFTELGVQRVIATTYQDNIGSRRVMEKVGLTLVRTFRLTAEDLSADESSFHSTAQEPWDGEDVEYALEKADWERLEAEHARRALSWAAGASAR